MSKKRLKIQLIMPQPCLEQSKQLKLVEVWTNESELFIAKCTLLLQTNSTTFQIEKQQFYLQWELALLQSGLQYRIVFWTSSSKRLLLGQLWGVFLDTMLSICYVSIYIFPHFTAVISGFNKVQKSYNYWWSSEIGSFMCFFGYCYGAFMCFWRPPCCP